MNRNFFCSLVALVLLSASAAAHAQMPEDNLAWKARCSMLSGIAAKIDAGAAPQALVAGTHSIPSIQFAEFAFDRSRASEHNVACTLFFLAAIAERAGNGGTANPRTAHNLVVVAESEVALIKKRKPTTIQHVKRGEEEAKQVGAKALNGDQSAAIITAADTIPITLPH